MSNRSGQGWTEDEISHVVDSWDRPIAQQAEYLGRSYQSIVVLRRKIKDGYAGPTKTSWTEAEDQVILDNPYYTAEQLTGLLPGRRVGAIRTRRAKLSNKPMVFSRSPFKPGGRTILARTCLGCGLLLPDSWYWKRGENGKFTTCKACYSSSHQSKQKSIPDAVKEERRRAALRRVAAYQKKAQEISLPGAERSGQEYTEADHVVLADRTLSNLAKALKLKRTFIATTQAVYGNGYSSALPATDPEREQWLIDNPNADRIEEIAERLQQQTPLVPLRPEFEWDD